MRKKSEAELLAMLPELSEVEKERRTRQGLADVDAGRTISHEEMMRWVDEQLVGSKKPCA
jgi:predicted transcriptional regulator